MVVSSESKNNKQKDAQKLEGVIEYCRAKNIPFEDEEDRYYKVHKFK